ncbi:MAG: right-handed parallel beta-helix repeat-containing protein [Chitinophagaceae bacterium]
MKKTITIAGVLLFSLLLISSSRSVAQKRVIPVLTDQQLVDGMSLGVQPSDTICIMAGRRGELVLKNITGTARDPVIIINRGGKVIIDTKKDYGILFNNSIHFRITGTGSGDAYGFEIASSANHGLVVTEFSSYCEADHLEIHHVGFAGIVAKTDPNCTRKDLRYFIMQQLSFHDNLIHDTDAEGFYVGYSWHPAREYPCGKDSLLYSHELHGVRIYNNTVYNSGQEGIQVGSGTKDVLIYSNSVFNYGMTNILWQNHGVQIGQGTTGDFFNNKVSTGPAEALSLFGGGNNRVYDNVIINSGVSAIYQNDRGAVAGSDYRIMNNTIISPGENGVIAVSDHTEHNKFTGNTIVTSKPGNAFLSEGRMKWDSSGNRIYSSLEQAGLDSGIVKRDTRKPVTSRFPFAADHSILLVEESGTVKDDYEFQTDLTDVSVRIYDGAGILLRAGVTPLKEKEYKIVCSGWENGVYYISVSAGSKYRQLRRIVVKKD